MILSKTSRANQPLDGKEIPEVVATRQEEVAKVRDIFH